MNDQARTSVDLSMLATLGSGVVVQELVGAIMSDLEGAEPDLVVEETLCLVATAAARALELALEDAPQLREMIAAGMLELPYVYRDYLLGRAVLEGAAESGEALAERIAGRLGRKMAFYGSHLPAGQFPSEHRILTVMELWMGRISPPRQEELPTKRLRRLGLVSNLHAHVKLLLAYGKRLMETGEE